MSKKKADSKTAQDKIDALIIRIDNKIYDINRTPCDLDTHITKRGETDYDFIEDLTDLLNECVKTIIDLGCK